MTGDSGNSIDQPLEPNVFISWSGTPSKLVALTLRDWLPIYSNKIRPWLSSVDIVAGAVWRQEIQDALKDARIGILCITQESILSPWLNFEAGALSNLPSSRIIPYLWGIRKADITGPLNHFQAVDADKAGTKELVDSICKMIGGDPAAAPFDEAWASLEKQLNQITDNRTFLERYILDREPPLDMGGVTRVSADRGYNILLYMFRRESFAKFRAFDLAFHRWEGLLDEGESWKPNIAVQIFRCLQELFKDRRCKDFRRLLIIDPSEINCERAAQVLSKIADHEQNWRRRMNAVVETRVLFSKAEDASRERIAALCDFATFSGESTLAIIETTLTSPIDKPVAFPKCEIVTSESKVAALDSAFDEFWSPSISVGEAVMEIKGPPLTNTLIKGVDKLYDCPCRDDCAVVIEGGYFDLRKPNSADRLQHLDHALRLWTHIRCHHRLKKERILLEAFLNDFTDERLCEVDTCGVDLESSKSARLASEFVREVFRERYKMFDLDPPQLFGMKKTRNAVSQVVRAAINSNRKDLSVVRENVYLEDTTEGRILLGYLRDGGRFVPRCTSLIAQHYYELHQWIRTCLGDVSQIWLFDFNLWTEQMSVKQGAAVACELYEWPNDMSMNIINFIYESGANSPTTFDHSYWP